MKFRKTKKFDTIESYASCVCLFSSCSCSCSCSCSNPNLDNSRKLGEADSKAQSVFNTDYYSYQNISG